MAKDMRMLIQLGLHADLKSCTFTNDPVTGSVSSYFAFNNGTFDAMYATPVGLSRAPLCFA